MGLIKGPKGRRRFGLRLDARWWIPAVLVLMAVVFQSVGDSAMALLRYGRAELLGGEVWRLVSGHLVHLNGSHLLLNAVGLLLVWLLVGHSLRAPQWWLGILAIVAGIDLGFWFLEPQLQWYVGLSGVLHGILVLGLLVSWRESALENSVILILIGTKLVYEQLVGPMPGSESAAGGTVIVNAHLYGAISGFVAAVVVLIRVRRSTAI